MARTTTTVRVAEGTFGVLDRYDIPIETGDWSTGLMAVMQAGALICAGINRGHVTVTVDVVDSPPAEIDPGPWEEIAEATVHAPHGELHIQAMEHLDGDRPLDLPLLSAHGPGSYRLRAHARGRDAYYDQVSDDSGEQYLLTIWPALPAPAVIIRATDRCGYGLRLANSRRPAVVATSPPAVQAARAPKTLSPQEQNIRRIEAREEARRREADH
jgi:hypothetical protein